MASPARERNPLLPHITTAGRKPSFLWYRGISMFARFQHYQQTFCPGFSYPCGVFTTWLELPGINVMIQTWGVWASFIVSFVSVGWWSAFGDRRGRKIVLLFSILGTLFLNLMYLVVANTALLREDAQDLMSVGLIVEGLLGGVASYNGVVHAYAFDVASTPLSRPVLFALIDALSLVGFIVGAIIGKFTRYNVSYIFTVLIALGNLTFIYALLPESLRQQDGARPPVPQRSSVFKSIFSPISVFFRGVGASKYLPLFGLAFYAYSLTSAMETSLVRFTDSSPLFPDPPRWLLLTVPRVLDLATLLCILPAITYFWQRNYGTTSRAGLHLAITLSHHSILLAALSCTAVLVFCLSTTTSNGKLFYMLFVPLYPLSVGAIPALYALGGAYMEALGRRDEVGVLFGALAVWNELGVYVSYSMYFPAKGIFWLSAFFLVAALMLLLPDPPPEDDTEEPSEANADADADDA
ncbi:hypothetical protein K438DRAFT_1891595 [Mycena galopus ATCC 62051]|nr:hypothetical protein K438DRAFT_1891595 [Mycena galopus ATCC 62051]